MFVTLTQERCNELFHYEKLTGFLIRKISVNNVTKAGDIAGANHNAGYRSVSIDNIRYLVHRIIWLMVYGVMPENDIDHINHNRSDNRLINLRSVDRSENLKNKKPDARNTSGCAGVHFHKQSRKWCAVIHANKKSKYLGLFINLVDAMRARKLAEDKYGYHKNHDCVITEG